MQVHRISGANHKGFHSRRDAECAWTLAVALGGVRALPPRGSIVGVAAAAPIPEPIMQAFDEINNDNFLGSTWYVVYKGKRPGVYPSW